MTRLQALKNESLSVTRTERAVLASELLDTLPGVLSDDDEGVAEALRRDAELEADPSTGIDWAAVKKAWSALVLSIFFGVMIVGCSSSSAKSDQFGHDAFRLPPDKALALVREYCEKEKISLSGFSECRIRQSKSGDTVLWVISFRDPETAKQQVILPGEGALVFTLNEKTRNVSVLPSY